MTPRLTILLGAGGVGKTTLAASLGLAMARAGSRTALLGIDPARRLRTALGLAELTEEGIDVPTPHASGTLHAALLDPSASLRRWIADDCRDEATRAHLLTNPYFLALADRLAGLTDAIGCARAAEWVERDTTLTDLVLDTAPGMPAVELLARPEKLMAFFDGKMMRWMSRLSRLGRLGRGHGPKILAGLADLSGAKVLQEFSGFMSTVDTAIATMVKRLRLARDWLKEPGTSLVIVCGVSDDAAQVSHALDLALRAIGFVPSAVVLNRTLPVTLAIPPPGADATAPERAFARYLGNYVHTQERVRRQLGDEFARVIEVPDVLTLDTANRLEGLAALGEPLRAALATHQAPSRDGAGSGRR